MQEPPVGTTAPASGDAARPNTEAFSRLGDLVNSIWAAAALASILDRGGVGPFPRDDPGGRLAAASGFLEETDQGLVATPAFAAAVTGRAEFLADLVRSTLGQCSTLALERGVHRGWAVFDDEILLAQGRGSAAVGGLILGAMQGLEGVAERFRQGGAFLDVGTGIGAVACTVCQGLPRASAVGIDPLRRAIGLATQTVTARGLEGRVELRCCGVQDLEDEDAFDVAWLPTPFVPRPAIEAGLPRLRRAIRSGGWLIWASAYLRGASPASNAAAVFQAHIAGGAVLDAGTGRDLLTAHGFADQRPIEVPPSFPEIFAVRRI